MLRRAIGLVQVSVCAIAWSSLCPGSALGQDRPAQLSALLFDEADEQLNRPNCNGVGNARVMYAAAQVLFQEYAALREGQGMLREQMAKAATIARERSCEPTINELVPPEGSPLDVWRYADPTPGGGGRVRDRIIIPEMVLATLYMASEKRDEYLSAINPETKAGIEAWEKANPERYEELSRALQTKALELHPGVDEQFKGYKIPGGKGTWVLPKDGKDWTSGAAGLPK